MSDEISQARRNGEDRAQRVQEREAACVALAVLWSNPFQMPKAKRTFYRCGYEVPLKEAQEMAERKPLDFMDYPPIDWSRACKLLGLPELSEAEVPLERGDQELVSRSLGRLDIRLEGEGEEADFIVRLRKMDRLAWAILVHASDRKVFEGNWRQRLKDLSPFSGAELIVLKHDDDGPAARFIRRIARSKGWIAEATWLRSRGREEKLVFVSVPRYM